MEVEGSGGVFDVEEISGICEVGFGKGVERLFVETERSDGEWLWRGLSRLNRAEYGPSVKFLVLDLQWQYSLDISLAWYLLVSKNPLCEMTPPVYINMLPNSHDFVITLPDFFRGYHLLGNVRKQPS